MKKKIAIKPKKQKVETISVKVLQDFKNEILDRFEEKAKETKRHFDVVAEDLKDDIQILAEQVASNTVKLEEHDQRFDKMDQRLDKVDIGLNSVDQRLDSVDQRLDKIEGTLEVVKSDLKSIKSDVKKKADNDDFVDLANRVSVLEVKAV